LSLDDEHRHCAVVTPTGQNCYGPHHLLWTSCDVTCGKHMTSHEKKHKKLTFSHAKLHSLYYIISLF